MRDVQTAGPRSGTRATQGLGRRLRAPGPAAAARMTQARSGAERKSRARKQRERLSEDGHTKDKVYDAAENVKTVVARAMSDEN